MLRFLVGVAAAALVVVGVITGKVPGFAPSGSTDGCGSEYVVQPGDTLSEVAERIYGRNARYHEIFAANRDRLTSPARIEAGEVLRIPCLEPAGSPTRRSRQEGALLAAIGDQMAEPSGAITDMTADAAVIRLAAVAGFAPYSDLDADQGGMLAALVTRAIRASEPGQEVRLGFTEDWFGNLASLKAGGRSDIGFPWFMPDCDAGEALTPELRHLCAEYLFSQPLLEVPIAFYVRAGDPLAEVRDLTELSGRRLCQGRDVPPLALDRLGSALKEMQIESAPDTVKCLGRLQSGEADVAVAVGSRVRTHIQSMGLTGAVREVPALGKRQTLHAIVRKSAPGAAPRLAALDHGLAQMKRSGEWFALVAASNAPRVGQ